MFFSHIGSPQNQPVFFVLLVWEKVPSRIPRKLEPHEISSNLKLLLQVVVGVEDFVLVAKCSVFRPKLDVAIVVIDAGWGGNSSKSNPDISVLKCHMCWGLDSQCFHIRGDGHQPNSRGLFTHYKDSLLKLGWPSPIQGV